MKINSLSIKYLFVFLLVFIWSIPQVIFAVWWNPISWFRGDEEIEIIKEFSKEEIIANSPDMVEKNPVNPKGEITRDPVVIERVVEKVITVNDPALQNQINALILENSSLRQQVKELSDQIKTLSSKSGINTDESSSVKTYQSEVGPLVDELEKIKEYIEYFESKMILCRQRSSVSVNLSDFPGDEDQRRILFDSKTWITCDSCSQYLETLKDKELRINKDIDMLKIRYGI
jgi:hypothetical protein